MEAAKAGATVVHCHVRDPETGKFSRDVALYREVMERIREADIDIIVNLTAGMGGDLEIGAGENPMEFGPNTDLVGPLTRLAHVEELLPEICTLDCGTLNFGDGDTIYVSTPAQLRVDAAGGFSQLAFQAGLPLLQEKTRAHRASAGRRKSRHRFRCRLRWVVAGRF